MHSETRSWTDFGPLAHHMIRRGQKTGNEHCSTHWMIPAANRGKSSTCKGKEHLFSWRANFAASREYGPPRMFGAAAGDNCKIRV